MTPHRVFIITDTHLGHGNMVKYCGRPEHHSEMIIVNTAMALSPGDVLIHLGDVCIGNDKKWNMTITAHLDVKHFLIRGNHDKQSTAWYLSHGWDFVADSFTGTYFGKKILFTHAPEKADGPFDLNIHGHLHNALDKAENKEAILSEMTEKNRLLVLEDVGYRPVLLDTFIRNSKSLK